MHTNVASILLAFFMGAPFVGLATPVTYRLEQIPTFDEPNGATLGIAFAMNELGEAVGIAEDAQLRARGFLYQAGQLSEIPGFGSGNRSDVRAINQFAEVAGSAFINIVLNGSPGTIAIPFTKAPGSPPRALLTHDEIYRDGLSGRASAINDAGTVAFEGRGPWVALGNGGRFPLDTIYAESMNNRGQLVGHGLPAGALGLEPMLYDLQACAAASLNNRSVARRGFAADINNSGVIVGDWGLHNNNRTVPVIWKNRVPRQLPFVHEHSAGWNGRALAINDRGDILGESQRNAERLNWILFAGEETPIPLFELLDQGFFDGFDDFMAFDLNNNRELAGAAIKHAPGAPSGSSNKPAILRPMVAQTRPRPAPGLWANPTVPGAGIEINRSGDRHYLVWFTYDEAGLPTWYFSDAIDLVRDGWRAELFRFFRTTSGTMVREPIGRVVLSSRAESTLTFSWRLAGRAGAESYRYLAGNCATGATGLTGTWYDPAAPGFGVSLQQIGDAVAGVYYFYDQRGRARWVFLDFPTGTRTADAWVYIDGACPGCAAATPVRSTVGLGELALAGNRIDLALEVAGGPELPALAWHSTNRMARLSTANACEQ